MTQEELSTVTAVSTTCFLSFLLPQCNSTKFLRFYFQSKTIPLDERLASALESYNCTSAGLYSYAGPRSKSLIDEQDDFMISAPFYRFLKHGLGTFLSCGRAFEGVNEKSMYISYQAGADFLRILAMAICPNFIDGDEPKVEVNLLATSVFPYAFHLVYADRLRLVRLCADDLVVPESIEDEPTLQRNSTSLEIQQSKNNELSSAIKMLRCCLLTFASYQAQSEQDACLAYKAIVNIIVCEGCLCTIQSEFKCLIEVLLKSSSKEFVHSLSENLSQLITRYNGSRYYADGDFTRETLIFLGKCIHERVLGIHKLVQKQGVTADKDEDDAQHGQQNNDKMYAMNGLRSDCKPYHFIALLKVTKSLFSYLLDDVTVKKMVGDTLTREVLDALEEEEKSKLQLIRNVSILLAYPSDMAVVKHAAELLALFFAYDKQYLSDQSNIKHMFACTTSGIENCISVYQDNGRTSITDSLKSVIYTVSRTSEMYAFNVLSYCLKNEASFWDVASIISAVQPRLTSRVIADLDSTDVDLDSRGTAQRILSYLSSTMTQNSKQFSFDSLKTLLKDDKVDSWILYQLVRQCYVTCNFSLARQILEKRLIRCSVQQTHYLWLDSLLRLSRAEELLRNDGYLAIPDCLANISASHSMMLSLACISSGKCSYHFGSLGRFDFQLGMLTYRAELLQLIKNARYTCLEYILSSNHTTGNTRSDFHLKNLCKCFSMLASRYMILYRMFGLHHNEQSRSALRGTISMCSFFSEVINFVFFEKVPISNATKQKSDAEHGLYAAIPAGDKNHPMGILLSRLRSTVEARDTQKPIGSEAVLDAIDVLLQCPMPFPSSFFVMKYIPKVYSTIIQTNEREMIDMASGVPFKLELNGIVPHSFITSAKVLFHQVVAWPSISFEGRLEEDEELDDTNGSKDKNEFETSKRMKRNLDTVTTHLLPGGKFILHIEFDPIIEEGYHMIDIQLGCRDVCCGEWLFPLQNDMRAIVRVSD